MGEYIQLISQDKKNIYLPKKVAELSEYMRKEIEKVDRDLFMKLEFQDVPFEVLEVLVAYLNQKYFYEQMKEIKSSYNEPYPIPENLSLDIVKKYL